jgi:hypothetical protein
MNLRRLLSASLLSLGIAAPNAVAMDPGAVASSAATNELTDPRSAPIDEQAFCAARESASADLAEFAGGHSADDVLAVVVLVVLLVVILI